MTAIGWYGPLIDLSKASLHIGDYVQLLVFVHRTRPIQKFKSSKRGSLLRTDVQVGDDTRLYFSVSLWQKEMGSMVVAGDVILLQNVKIIKFGDVVEARTVQFSSLIPLVHPYELLVSKGVDDLLARRRVGITTQEKLKKVIEWVQRSGATLHSVQLHTYQNRKLLKNWKVHKEEKYCDCVSISEISCLTISCKAAFYACVGEIFLPFTCRTDGEFDKERMFVSKRLFMMGDNKIAEDLICMGCKLCGYPLDLEYGSLLEKNMAPLYFQKRSNCLHVACLIYKPFLLYVWDQSDYIPLLVTNKSAELLFGNITAERVYQCYRGEKMDQNPVQKEEHVMGHYNQRAYAQTKASQGKEAASSRSLKAHESLQVKSTEKVAWKKPNFYRIWLILLKMLVQQGKNSSLIFKINVNTGLNQENGRFEFVSVTMPCIITNPE